MVMAARRHGVATAARRFAVLLQVPVFFELCLSPILRIVSASGQPTVVASKFFFFAVYDLSVLGIAG